MKFRYLQFFLFFFYEKNQFLADISLKIDIFKSAMLYYDMVTSYIDRLSWFWYQWKKKTLYCRCQIVKSLEIINQKFVDNVLVKREPMEFAKVGTNVFFLFDLTD